MVKAIIFDLDGVLIDSKDIHFNAFNKALSEVSESYVISKADQDDLFEGMTTTDKLNMLTNTRGLPKELHSSIWTTKQTYSLELFKQIQSDQDLVALFRFLKSRGIKIAVASNSVRDTVDTCLKLLGIKDYVDYSLSNEDVLKPKPDPEMYSQCIYHFGISPQEAVIFEDSEVGITAAKASGARVEKVLNRNDVYFERIDRILHET